MLGAEQEDLENGVKPLRVMLLGKSGAGKSSSGNTILGREAFKSDMKLTRVTQHCKMEKGKVENVYMDVIDTPGLFEKNGDQEKIIREILQSVRLRKPGPHAFVYVVPLGRMTQEDQDTHNLIETIFGPRVWDYTIVLFTHGDRLQGKTINDVITESDDNLHNFIHKCSGSFHVFDNKNPEDVDQVTSFVAKIETLTALNGGKPYGYQLYPKKERNIWERQERILNQREEEICLRMKQLEESYEGDELEKMKSEVWRKEEEAARLAAEKLASMWPIKLLLPVICLVGLVICAEVHPVIGLAFFVALFVICILVWLQATMPFLQFLQAIGEKVKAL